MKAVVYKDAFNIAVEEVPEPWIQEAVGYQAHAPGGQEQPEIVMDWLVNSVRATGRLGVIRAYMPQDPGAATDAAKDGRIGFDFGRLFQKGLSVGTGQCPVKRFNEHLRDLITAGKATPF